MYPFGIDKLTDSIGTISDEGVHFAGFNVIM